MKKELLLAAQTPRRSRLRCGESYRLGSAPAIPYQAVMKTRCNACVLCAMRRSHLHRGEFILKVSIAGRTIDFTESGNGVGLRSINRETGDHTMLNKFVAAAAMAAIAFVAVPAHAAKVTAGCSGDNLAKTESAIETSADGEGKSAAQKEIALAQEALLSGKMGVCAAHLSKAQHDTGAAR